MKIVTKADEIEELKKEIEDLKKQLGQANQEKLLFADMWASVVNHPNKYDPKAVKDPTKPMIFGGVK